MTDWRKLSLFHRERVDRNIRDSVEPGHFRNEHNGFEWDDPEYTLDQVHSGNYCADCLRVGYNCLCWHNT